MSNIRAEWNHLNYSWGKLPEAFRAGRDRMSDLLVFRPQGFGNALTLSINGAELQLQGAEHMVDRIGAKALDPAAVERIGLDLMTVVEEQMRLGNENSTRHAELQTRIDQLKMELQMQVSGRPVDRVFERQVARIIENYRQYYVFRRQAATVLASQILHDVQLSDMIAQTSESFKVMREGYSMSYFHNVFAREVTELLLQINVVVGNELEKIEVAKQGPKNIEVVTKQASEKTKGVVEAIVNQSKNVQVITESSTFRKEANTPAERARSAAGRAARR